MIDKYESFQQGMLEESKRIGVPNLALEQAERAYQRFMMLTNPTVEDAMEVMQYMGAAKFSTAHHDRAGLFDSISILIQDFRHNYLRDSLRIVLRKPEDG